MLKIGICGFGVMGKNHFRNYKKFDNVEVIKIYDPELFEYNSWELFAESCKSMDGVSICCPTIHHVDMALKILEINKNIKLLIEKPIGSNVQDSLKLFKYDNILVGHIERFNPVIIEFKRLYNNRFFGDIYSVHAIRCSPFPSRKNNNNVALDLLVHDIDVMNFIFESLPMDSYRSYQSSFCNEVIDYAHIFCLYDVSGITVNSVFEANWFSPVKVRSMDIFSTEGKFNIDYINQRISGVTVYGKEVLITPVRAEPLYLEINHFISLIKKEALPICSANEGINVLKVLLGERNEK